MKLFKLVFLSVLCLFFTACRVSRQVVKSEQIKQDKTKDHKVFYRDTILKTPRVETSFKLPLSSLGKYQNSDFKGSLKGDSKGQIFSQKNGNARVIVKALHDTITVTAQCDSVALAAKIKQEYSKEYSNYVGNNNEFVEKKTRINWLVIIVSILISFFVGFFAKSLIKKSI